MAYSPGSRITNFSNPDVFFDGQPTGVPIGEPDEADNASTVNLTSVTISSYRCGLPFCDVDRLDPSDGADDDFFANSVAFDGDIAISGSILADSTYVYRYDAEGDVWNEEDQIVPDDVAAGDLYGEAVAISGDRVIIGASGHDGVATNAGGAWVFRYDGAAWIAIEEAEGDQQDADFYCGS